MACNQILPLLSPYFDGVLEPVQRVAVRQHVAGCEACASRLAEYEKLDKSIAASLSITPRAGFRNAVLARTSHRQYPASAVSSRSGKRFGQIAFGSLTGATVAVLAILLVVAAANVTPHHGRPSNLAASGGDRFKTARPTPGHMAKAPYGHVILTPTLGVSPWPSQTQPVVASIDHNTPVPPVDRAALVRVSRETILSGGAVHGPLWSPDSKSILYLSNWDFTCADGWYCGTLQRYTAGITKKIATDVRAFTWSPDGQEIAFASQAHNYSSLGEPQTLHIATAAGTGSRAVVDVDRANVEWLPIGILAVRSHALTLIDPVSGRYAPLSDLPAFSAADESSAFFAVSENGRFVAYQDGTGLRVWDRRRHGVLVLWQPLSKFGTSSFHFSWDGNTIFYSTYDQQYTKLFRLQLAPLGQALALNDGRPLHGPIDLVGPPSADNSVVNFRIGIGASARNYVIDAGHGSAHMLLPPDGVGPLGWWSPDGHHLIYMVYRGDSARFTAIAAVHNP
jgi:Putative zinc-finger/WD40-like Beta Propeller Repeat